MIVWGSKGHLLLLAPAGEQNCEICERDRTFHVVLQYRVWGLYWIFTFITKKEYMVLCEICERGWGLDAVEIEERLKDVGEKSPIPFMHQYGFFIFIGVVILISILVS